MKANKKIKNPRQDINKHKRSKEDSTKSEERFRAIFETAQDSIFIKDRELRYIQVNPAMERLFGLPASELIGKTDAELFGEEAGSHIAEMDSRVLAGEIVEKENTKPVRGSLYTFHVIKAPMRNSSGEIVGLCGIARDITARKQTEEALRESRQKFDTMAENVPGILFRAIVHKDGSITLPYVSPSAREFGLYGAEEMSVRPELLSAVIHPDYLEHFKKMTVAASGKLEPVDWEIQLNTQFTSIEFIRVIARPKAMADGDVAWDGLALDITAHMQAEEALVQNERRFRLIMENTSDGINIVEYNPKTYTRRLIMCNDCYVEMSGRSREELMATDDLNRFTREIECYTRPFHEQTLKGLPSMGLSCWNRPDGEENYYEWIATPQKVGDKYHIIGIDRDITERRQTEEALRESEEQYRTIFESTTDGLLIFDFDGTIVETNPAACAMYGYSYDKMIGLSGKDIVHPEYHHLFDNFKQQIKATGQFFAESVNVRKDGSTIDVEVRGSGFTFKGKPRLLAVVHDITERKQAEKERQKLEEQLRQAARMEAIGRLAGGIAHDFNNMLAIIQGYTDLLLKSMSEDDSNRDDVESIRIAASRAAALTRQLLAFGRKQTIQPKVLDLNEIIADADSMLQRIIGEDVELVTKPGKDLWHVRVDPRQIEEQVVLNLAVNAREAMPNGGKITIATANIVLDEDYARRHVEVVPGEYVMLAVNDTGTGMSEETMSHVFEPFFTTKETGKSSGLGLSTIYGIIKQSGGHIQVSSTQGKGSTFKIYLPRAAEPAELAAGGRGTRRLPKGTETVLVAEDEPAVRDLTCRILREQGYTVLKADNGAEAMRAAGKHAEGEIHLLITDVIMPHMSGKELAERVRDTHPNTKVLFVSGYTGDGIAHHGVLDKSVNFLAKPFTSRQLIRTVRRVLDADA